MYTQNLVVTRSLSSKAVAILKNLTLTQNCFNSKTIHLSNSKYPDNNSLITNLLTELGSSPIFLVQCTNKN